MSAHSKLKFCLSQRKTHLVFTAFLSLLMPIQVTLAKTSYPSYSQAPKPICLQLNALHRNKIKIGHAQTSIDCSICHSDTKISSLFPSRLRFKEDVHQMALLSEDEYQAIDSYLE